MSKIRNTIITLLLIFSFSKNTNAQFISAIVGIDGLTCSACSYATEKSILKLIFVDSVYMELDKNIATVFFKKNIPVSIKSLSQKVYDAGFAVRSIHAIVNIEPTTITNDYCLILENNLYHFIKIDGEKKLSGPTNIKFIGEKLMQKQEFKKWKLFCSSSCKSQMIPTIKNEYFVTIP
ncbi:MAG: heavy-metal-associated domain-containing protein [Bacteroidetes bacterium]|nr:heavy-metal-associated domain-containing protein [Bacteroidota bacterium]